MNKKRFSRSDFNEFIVKRSARVYIESPESVCADKLRGFIAEAEIPDDEILDLAFRHYRSSDYEIGEPVRMRWDALSGFDICRFAIALPFFAIGILLGGRGLVMFIDTFFSNEQ